MLRPLAGLALSVIALQPTATRAIVPSEECTTLKCVRARAARVHGSVAATGAADFARGWSRRGGGNGSVLYILPDRSYWWLYWDDVAVRIVDVGRWKAAEGILELEATAAGAEHVAQTRRYVALRTGAAAPAFLVPLDELLERSGDAASAVDSESTLRWLEHRRLRAGRPIASGDVAAIVKRLAALPRETAER